MPRVGSRPFEQSQGGNFVFEEGRGVIVNSVIGNHAIPGYATDCGYKVTIQRLTPDGKQTNDEPVTEFLKAGSVEVFHPGRADGPDDRSPELEIGGAKDAGTDQEAEGNCLLTTGRGPNSKGKLVTFTNAAIDQGLDPKLFDGWAGQLIGLDAHFTQKMMEKVKGSEKDATCLIIGKGGKTSPDRLVYKYPDGSGVSKVAAPGAGAGTGMPAGLTPIGARVTPPAGATQAGQPVNGAAVPGAAGATGSVAVESTVTVDVGEIAERALASMIPSLLKSKTPMTRRQIGIRMQTVLLADKTVPQSAHQPVLALVKKDPSWFDDYAAAQGWVVTGSGESAAVQFGPLA